MLSSLVLLTLLAAAQGRAVNISNTWVLPEEGFPVFYRYFRDRISWYEADAVCQFHHANLVTVDTTAQYDAVRAYLKELDISSAVWVGLIRSNPDGDFTWTDYRGLSGDGYWSSAPDMRSAPLCAASNPAADYRWEARACGGPTVASFICELPVPQWALGNEGCMVQELPALTILYLPESAAVQLNADCGLAGVKRVQCTGNVKREGLLKDLSCADEEDISSTSTLISMVTNWPASTDSTADQDITSEATIDENTTTELEVDTNQPIVITATSLSQYIISKTPYKSHTKDNDIKNFSTVTFGKDVNLEGINDHNIESNFIPKHVDEGNVLTNEQLERLEDERHKQHKMLHEEIARVGNVDNIFTQPTDHFIPPLVMAKSKMNDDMTVLSLAEKHAQQLAEKHFNKHSQRDFSDVESYNKQIAQMDKSLITSSKPNKVKETKKDNLKLHVPKKYVNEKYHESKLKVGKPLEYKTNEIVKPIETTQTPTTTKEESKTTTAKGNFHYQDKIDEDFAMDLTIMLKDAPLTSEEQATHLNYVGDVAKLDAITKKLDNSKTPNENMSTTLKKKSVENNTMQHEVIKITVVSNENSAVNTTVFEITTKMPIFRDGTEKTLKYSTSFPTTISKETQHTEDSNLVSSTSTPKADKEILQSESTSVPVATTSFTENSGTLNVTAVYVPSSSKTDLVSTVLPYLSENKTEITEILTTITSAFYSTDEEVTTDVVVGKIDTDDLSTNSHHDTTSIESITSFEKDYFNNTEDHDLPEKNMTDTEEIADVDSPLLSGAYEPIHRPPRTRTPPQQGRKFNPFRILG